MLRRSRRKRSASTMIGKHDSTVPTNPSAVAPVNASTSQRSTWLSTANTVTNFEVSIASGSGVTAKLPSPLLGNNLDSSHKTCIPTENIMASDNISRNVS